MTAPAEEIDEPEEPAVEHDDATPRRVSFFASSAVLDTDLRNYAAWIEIEEADEAVCARVWEIFAKDSTARGFDARSARSKRASAALAERWAKDGTAEVRKAARDKNLKEDETMGMKNEAELTERFRAVLAVCRDAEAKGEKLTNLEVANRAKMDGANDASRGSNASNAVCTLRRMGLLGKPGGATIKPKREPEGAARAERVAPPRRPKASPSSKPAIEAVVSNPLVAELVARRDAAAAQVAKLDAAIAAVRAAL